MDVTQTAPAAAPAPAPAAAEPASARASATLASDFDTFLTLLTAQIENQDPLNPADSTEFASQLATFSNVEQNVQTNSLLERLLAQADGQSLDGLAGWIGMEARTTGATHFDGGEITVEANVSRFADRAEIVVSAPDGTEVGRLPTDPRSESHTFQPKDAEGRVLPVGAYSYHVESWSGGQTLQRVDAARYVSVREVLVDGGQPILGLDGGVRTPSSTVSGLRPGPNGG